MATLNEYYPQEVLHPCVTLKEKLEEMGMTQKEFAIRTGKPEKTIFAVLKGESAITSEMAVMFENITKIPAHFWINKQARYNEYKARLKRKVDVENAEEWTKSFPYAEMAKNNWVPKTRKLEEKTINLFEYFGVSTHEAWDKLYMKSELKVAAYTSLAHTHEPEAVSAWLRQGELQAEQIDVPEYDKGVFLELLPLIKEVMANHPEDYFLQLQALCSKAGVKVFYTPKLPKAPISGSTRWIKNTPVIQLSARYRQNDRFWFTFFHEAGHILRHGKKYISLEGVNFSGSDPKKEQEANEFAEEWTFSAKQEQEVINAAPLNREDIISFAKKFNTHPAMIIGRLHHLGLVHFSEGREFIKSIDLTSCN
ncbi:ImmA/IrrE family metallo-endopeptidase [Marinifilum sp. D737]|uniref:ImmA/IrrE family metallo-endopeptidase n=1 Tax=Marinifilum sp. D737 TaxID=2969628 RepID=UPI0022761508|nr:ImmA/IrrE family metallo-endopeptidase [Marinifilum sp. D737]MCY1636585.1 ImmA/IrrE family metallo-endopeptidase [Marinifilum sp. D737]